jgi:Cu/Zn superoxide dismutase
MGTAVDLQTTITTVTIAYVWMIHSSMKMKGVQETALCISGEVMEDVTMTTMFAVVTGTVETAVGTKQTRIHTSMAIASSASAAIRCSIHAMENVRCSAGLETATATTRTTTAVVIGMAETAAQEWEQFYIAKNVAV